MTGLVFREVTMARATARHILVASESACAALKTDIENGADFAEVARSNAWPGSRALVRKLNRPEELGAR